MGGPGGGGWAGVGRTGRRPGAAGGMPGIAGRLGDGWRTRRRQPHPRAGFLQPRRLSLRRGAVPADGEHGRRAQLPQPAAHAEHRRAVQDPGRLQGQDQRVVLPELQRRLRRQPVRGVFDRADAGDARRRLLGARTSRCIDPLTGLPFPNNQIPASRIDPAALALLQYYPLPNQPGDAKNYYRSSTTGNRSDDINFRFTKSFGAAPGRRGGAAGARGGGGGRGGRAAGADRTSRSACSTAGPTPIATARFPTTVGLEQGQIVERAGELHLQQVGHVQHAERPVQPRQVRVDEPLRVPDRRGRRGGHRRRVDRPVLVGHPVAVVHERERPARPDAGDPHGPDAHGRA